MFRMGSASQANRLYLKGLLSLFLFHDYCAHHNSVAWFRLELLVVAPDKLCMPIFLLGHGVTHLHKKNKLRNLMKSGHIISFDLFVILEKNILS